MEEIWPKNTKIGFQEFLTFWRKLMNVALLGVSYFRNLDWRMRQNIEQKMQIGANQKKWINKHGTS